MRRDLKGSIREVASFLGVPDFDHVDELAAHLDIESFRENDAVNMKPAAGSVPDHVRRDFDFIRSGFVGGWKSKLDEEKKILIQNWIDENNKELQIQFTYE